MLSVEPIHLYGIWTSDIDSSLRDVSDPAAEMRKRASKTIASAMGDVMPLLAEVVAATCRQFDAELSVCFLIDDKFRHRGTNTDTYSVHDAAKCIDDTWNAKAEGYALLKDVKPLIVSENSLDKAAIWVLERILSAPTCGQGSSENPKGDDSIVVNYLESVKGEGGLAGQLRRQDLSPFLGEPDIHQDIRLLCQIYSQEPSTPAQSDRNPTCTLLSATWQLARLGLIPDAQLPKPILVSDKQGAASWVPAERTISILPMSLIAVEHGVRLILSQYQSTYSSFRSTEDVLSKVAYIFLPEGWIKTK